MHFRQYFQLNYKWNSCLVEERKGISLYRDLHFHPFLQIPQCLILGSSYLGILHFEREAIDSITKVPFLKEEWYFCTWIYSWAYWEGILLIEEDSIDKETLSCSIFANYGNDSNFIFLGDGKQKLLCLRVQLELIVVVFDEWYGSTHFWNYIFNSNFNDYYFVIRW